VQLVKVGSKGQVSIPKVVLDRLGIKEQTPMLVDVTEDGTILLRQAGVYPIEIYSEERIREFDKADRLTASERRKLKALKR
jgi:AbrB family looped-hinge helix DNA binding protein